MLLYVFEIFACFIVCFGQNKPLNLQNDSSFPTKFHKSIGNFSVELLYHATLKQGKQNLMLSPITAWTVLAVTAEGAYGNTRRELNKALRITANHTVTRQRFKEIAKWLVVNTTTIELAKFNAIFLDKSKHLEPDFQRISKLHYDTGTIALDFKDGVGTANTINRAISTITKGWIPKLVEESYFGDTQMLITSAVYLKGQWTAPFNAWYTIKQAFLDSNGKKIGEVNMMYNRFTYPFAYIQDIQARVIELPYGKENRLSMLIMLPNHGVTLQETFLKFEKVALGTVFSELRLSEVECFIPRFKIESNLDLTDILKKGLFVNDLFDPNKSNLGGIARTRMYVTRVIHKAEIEVTEEGTVAPAITAAEFENGIEVVRFEAKRPFIYVIVEKVTNAILFGGVYQQPILY